MGIGHRPSVRAHLSCTLLLHLKAYLDTDSPTAARCYLPHCRHGFYFCKVPRRCCQHWQQCDVRAMQSVFCGHDVLCLVQFRLTVRWCPDISLSLSPLSLSRRLALLPSADLLFSQLLLVTWPKKSSYLWRTVFISVPSTPASVLSNCSSSQSIF